MLDSPRTGGIQRSVGLEVPLESVFVLPDSLGGVREEQLYTAQPTKLLHEANIDTHFTLTYIQPQTVLGPRAVLQHEDPPLQSPREVTGMLQGEGEEGVVSRHWGSCSTKIRLCRVLGRSPGCCRARGRKS